MRISCLQPYLFLLCEAMLETLCLLRTVHIISFTLRQNNFFFSFTLQLWTLAIKDTKSPAKGVRDNGSQMYYYKKSWFWKKCIFCHFFTEDQDINTSSIQNMKGSIKTSCNETK